MTAGVVLCVIALVLQALCLVRWRVAGAPVPLFALFAGFVFSEFGVGHLLRALGVLPELSDRLALQFEVDEGPRGAVLGLTGLIAACLSYLACHLLVPRVRPAKGCASRFIQDSVRCLASQDSRGYLIVAISLLLPALAVGARRMPLVGDAASTLRVEETLVVFLGVGIFFPASRWVRVSGCLAIAFVALLALSSGLLYAFLRVLWPCVIAFGVRFGWRRLAWIVAISLPMLAIGDYYKQFYRDLVWQRGEEPITALLALADSPAPSARELLTEFFDRHDYSFVLGRADEMRGSLGPASFGFLAYGFVPRVLWPGKPIRNEGNEVGHHLGLLDPDDFSTSANVHGFSEGILGIGVIGLLVVGCGFGGVWFLLERLSAIPGTAAGSASLAAAAGGVWACESGFSTWVVGVVASVLTFVVAGLLLSSACDRPRAYSPAIPPRFAR